MLLNKRSAWQTHQIAVDVSELNRMALLHPSTLRWQLQGFSGGSAAAPRLQWTGRVSGGLRLGETVVVSKQLGVHLGVDSELLAFDFHAKKVQKTRIGKPFLIPSCPARISLQFGGARAENARHHDSTPHFSYVES
jgi:hypothetical protein